jgi:hypothetical protein
MRATTVSGAQPFREITMQARRRLSNDEWCYRSLQLTEAFIPWLRERYPVGGVAIINLLTAELVVALHTQINSIETELRGMKRDKLVTRVADLEDEVFGKTRA